MKRAQTAMQVIASPQMEVMSNDGRSLEFAKASAKQLEKTDDEVSYVSRSEVKRDLSGVVNIRPDRNQLNTDKMRKNSGRLFDFRSHSQLN